MLELKIILNDPILREVYRRGIKRGIWWFARWKDGKQVVGMLEYPIDHVLRSIDDGEYDK